MDLATVYNALEPADAQLARSRLEAAGFHPYVTSELSALSLDGYSLAAGGIQVKVPAEEAEEARLLIQDFYASHSDDAPPPAPEA